MAITHVKDVYRQDTTDAAPTHAIGTTSAGNGLVIVFIWGSKDYTISNVAISGETVTAFTNGVWAGDSNQSASGAMYYVKDLGSGGTKTVTATLSGSTPWTCAIFEISGQDTTTFDDGTATFSGTGQYSATPSVNVVPTVANCFILAACNPANGSPTKGAVYTAPDATWTANNFYNGAEYLADAGAPGTKAVDFTCTEGRWYEIAVVVRPAGGAPTTWGRMLGLETNRLVRTVG